MELQQNNDVGDWLLAYVATNDGGYTGSITFTLSVKPWFIGWDDCNGQDFDKCISWQQNYYLENSQCKITWSKDKIK